MNDKMNERLQERLPEASTIINSLKKSIDTIHSACGESDAVLFRQDLAILIGKWAERLNNGTKGDYSMDDKEKIIRLHEKLGLDVKPIRISAIPVITRDSEGIKRYCDSAIEGLEETVNNLKIIRDMPDFDMAKHALLKEMAVTVKNSGEILNFWIPEISEIYTDSTPENNTPESNIDWPNWENGVDIPPEAIPDTPF